MNNIDHLTPLELQSRGMQALKKELGLAGMIRFMQMFDKGQGDWTKERYGIVTDLLIDEIIADLTQNDLNEIH